MAINPSQTLLLLVHLSRFESPSSSKESTSSQLEEEQRSRSQSVTAPSSIPGFDNGCLYARRGAGEGISDSGKLANLKNGNGAIDQELRLPEALSERLRPATVQGKMAGRVPMAYVLRIGGRRFLPCALFHRSRGQDVGQFITKPMTNWTRASTTLKEHPVGKTHRESVSDACTTAKGRPQRCPARSSTKRRRYLGKQAETLLDLGLRCQLRLEMMRWN